MAGKKIEIKLEGPAPIVSDFKPGNYYSLIKKGIDCGGYIEKKLKWGNKNFFNTLREINEESIINTLYEIIEKDGIVLNTKVYIGRVIKKDVSKGLHWKEVSNRLSKARGKYFQKQND